jgi:formylglycine-generating enzyme required for sulfatase activity
MGCTQEQRCAERLPERIVEFEKPFQIGKTEVTVGQFRAFVRATGYTTEAEKAGDRRTWRDPGFLSDNRQPVVFVSFQDAEAYCTWIGARIPSEAEWEYASRAGAPTWHFFGDRLDDRYVWWRGNSNQRPQPVGRKPPNAWGLHDVEGNVWEWVRGEAPYHRVFRGGSFMSCPDISPWDADDNRLWRIVVRRAPDKRDDDIGFRCAR